MLSEDNSTKAKPKFPARMFITAAMISGFMVFMISSVLSQANAPCLHSYSLQNSTIVNTSHHLPSQIDNDNLPLTICNRNNQQISWLTWLFNRSDSAEFHYLDLLELLSRR